MIFAIITCYFLASSRVKLILCRDVIILDKWFSDSKEICEHLTSRGDHRMSYVHLPVENLDKKQSVKGEISNKGCMAGHLFIYTPYKDDIMRKYLCDCEECLYLNFLSYVKNTSKFIKNKNNDTDDSEDRLLDEENDLTKISESVTIPSFVAVTSFNSSEPIYFIKIVDKNLGKENFRDRFGHEVFLRECNLKEFYLQKD